MWTLPQAYPRTFHICQVWGLITDATMSLRAPSAVHCDMRGEVLPHLIALIYIFWGAWDFLISLSSFSLGTAYWAEISRLQICVGSECGFVWRGYDLWVTPRWVNVTFIRNQSDAAGGSCCFSSSVEQRLRAIYRLLHLIITVCVCVFFTPSSFIPPPHTQFAFK